MKNNSYKYVVLTVVLIASGLLLWASKFEQKKFNSNHEKPVQKVIKKVFSEQELIARLDSLSAHLSPKNSELFLEGEMQFKEIGENVGSPEAPVKYVFSKKGKEFYYQLGEVIYLNNEKFGLVIDHDQKQISILKSIDPKLNLMPGNAIQQMAMFVKTEGYSLSSTENGNMQTIFLKNKNHFSCKEYSFTFDTLTYMPKQISAYLTGNSNAESSNGEKHYDITLNKAARQASVEAYFTNLPVQMQAGKFKIDPAYKSYEVLGLKVNEIN